MDKKLFFREDGTFKLLQLTDIHYSEDSELDHKTVRLMRELIQAEKPDFIMTTGDTVYGKRNAEYLRLALEPILESGIDWGFVFGNHDVEFAGSREMLFAQVTALPGCRSYHDPASKDGMGNCVLELCGADGKAQWLLFGMDSGDYNPDAKVGGYGLITSAQISWYRQKIREYEESGAPFSAMVFQHMALPEHAEVWNYEVCYGTKRDGVGCPNVNSGFFYQMLEAGHAKGVFVGHDHVNDYWGYLYGIALGYGRCTGFGTYGAQDYLRGGRVFRFRQGDVEHFETYVRLEHGIVVNEPWIQHPVLKRDEG